MNQGVFRSHDVTLEHRDLITRMSFKQYRKKRFTQHKQSQQIITVSLSLTVGLKNENKTFTTNNRYKRVYISNTKK